MRPTAISLVKNLSLEYARDTIFVGSEKLAGDTSLRKGRILGKNTIAAMDGLGSCVGVAIFSPQKKFLAHSAPELDLPQFISKPIKKIIGELRENLQHSYDEIVAFISGGIAWNEKNKLSHNSAALVNAYYEELTKQNIPTTVVASQFGDGLNTRLNTYITSSSLLVGGKPIDTLELTKKSTKEEIQDVLEKHFDFVEISPSFPINFLDKTPKYFK